MTITLKDLTRLAKQIPTAAYLYAALSVGAVGAYGLWTAHQRQIGRLEVLTTQATAQRDSLAIVLKGKVPQFQRDTVRIVRSVHTIDTLIQHRIDTALVRQTDTVKITVAEARAVRDTILACQQTIRDCASIQRDLWGVIRADSLIIRSLQTQMPGKLAPWRDRLLGAAAGYAIGRFMK